MLKVLQVVADVLANGTFRRALVALLALLTVALNKKFGLNLDAEGLVALVATAVAYMIQSAAKEAHVERSDALVAAAEASKPASPASNP